MTVSDGVSPSPKGGIRLGRDVASLKLTEGHELWAGRHRVMWSPSAEGGRNEAPRGGRVSPSHPSGRGGERDTPPHPPKFFLIFRFAHFVAF